VGTEAALASQAPKIETVAAARIQNDVARRCGNYFFDRLQQWRGHTTIVQSPPPLSGRIGIARLLGSPILRLKQVDVSAARNVERMPALADYPVLFAHQLQLATADWTA
jgi:hypothetical protein